ncbi:MAG: aldehyde dehydrogenase family protein [Chloracidobacterium sp.]|nr:aldehyde dehydrogenase family protein [Chloracidobacterium sp.]
MSDYNNFINGAWEASASEQTLDNVNPADTSDVLGTVRSATRDEARRAVEAAEAARRDWKATPPPVRGKILFRAAGILDDNLEDLARIMTREEGKTLTEARGEVRRSINIMEYIAGEGRRIAGETIYSELPSNFAYTIKQPLGVIACITPWNFPVAIPVWKIAPALVAGNTVVFKPATALPATSTRLVEIFEEAGVPAGVLNLVIGSGSEAGDEIVGHPAVSGVSFTGSNDVGIKLYEQVARRGAKALCEMGGKNPMLVMEDADINLAVDATAKGAFGATGQRCSATSRAIVVDSIADEFVEKLVKRADSIVVGNGADEATQMGPVVDRHQYENVLRYIESGREDGAEMLCGGAMNGEGANGYFIRPTVFDRVTSDMRIAREEIFGPVLAVMRVGDFDEAMSVANDSEYGLTSAIFTKDNSRVFRFVDEIETGVTHINSATVGGEAHIPFGGIKATGVGSRELGSMALDFYVDVKVVYVDYTGEKRTATFY